MSRRVSIKPKAPHNVIGPRIRRIRLAAKTQVSQEDMSARLSRLGVMLGQSQVSAIESGRRGINDVEIIAFAKALRVPVQALFE